MSFFRMAASSIEFRNLACTSVLLALTFFPIVAFGQVERTLIKTDNGCSIASGNAWESLLKQPKNTYELSWIGICVDGMAEGPGEIRLVSKFGEGDSAGVQRLSQLGNTHQGQSFGFARIEIDSQWKMLGPRKHQDWQFAFGGRKVSSNKTSLIESLLTQEQAALLKRSTIPFEPLNRISTGSTALMLTSWSCAMDRLRFPECGFGDGEQKHEVYYFEQKPVTGDFDADYKNRRITYCPEPKNPASCAQMSPQLVGPMLTNIEEFIRESLPKVRQMEGAMQDVLAREKRQRTDAADRAASEQAAANAAFDAKLDKTPVGELFAMADEYKSKGEITRARTVLRKLMGRFPDHRLAILAASMLTEMQGK